MDLVLSGGTVVTALDPPSVTFASIAIRDGRVAAVEGGVTPAASSIDCTGCLVIPGNVCAHHHLYSSLARGMPYRLKPPETFVQILQRVWWRLDRALDPSSIHWSAWSGGADALLAGTTTIVDHHASPFAIEDSLESVDRGLRGLGVRRILCYEVTDRDGLDTAAAGLEETHRRLKENISDGEGLGRIRRTMVGAHASFTLSAETLAACVSLANEFDVGIHVHVAEDAADQRDAEARFGRRVIERLADAGALTERSLLAHCVHVDDREIDLIRDSGAWVAHNPRSNMNNSVGYAPTSELRRAALGTDGMDEDMFAEMRVAYLKMREAGRDDAVPATLQLVAGGHRLAAALFGLPFGKLDAGAPADLVILDYDPPGELHGDNLAGHLLFGIDRSHVRSVMVAGRWALHDRRLAGVDASAVFARARAAARDLWSRMESVV